jgi:hypothetical protein
MLESYETIPTVIIIAGMVQGLKTLPVFESDKAKRWLPFASLGLGVILGVGFNLLLYGDFRNGDFHHLIMQGITYGLMASGVFSYVKQLRKRESSEKGCDN